MSDKPDRRDPRAKFVELANARVARAVKDLRLIGNLSNRHNYNYTDDEAKTILKVLEVELEALRTKFRPKPGEVKNIFKI